MSQSDQQAKEKKPTIETDMQLSDQELEQVNGGWGRTMYYSYSESASASYTSKSSDSSNR